MTRRGRAFGLTRICRTLILVVGLSLLPLVSPELVSLLPLALLFAALSPPFPALSVVFLLPAMAGDIVNEGERHGVARIWNEGPL